MTEAPAHVFLNQEEYTKLFNAVPPHSRFGDAEMLEKKIENLVLPLINVIFVKDQK